MNIKASQRTFFDDEHESDMRLKRAEPIDPNVEPEDKPRLRGQNAQILDRLQQGPATNRELSEIGLKYTSRISDLRKAGYEIDCKPIDGGLTQYRLRPPSP